MYRRKFAVVIIAVKTNKTFDSHFFMFNEFLAKHVKFLNSGPQVNFYSGRDNDINKY